MKPTQTRSISPKKQPSKSTVLQNIDENTINEDLEEVKKLEEKIVQITEKNIAVARENEVKSYENTRDQRFINFRKSIISGQRDKRRRLLEQNQEQIDKSNELKSNIESVQSENQNLQKKIQDLLDDQFPEELTEDATKEERIEFMKKKIRALQIKNKIQRQMLATSIPSAVVRMQLVKDSLQKRVDIADERRKQANAILQRNDREKLFPQKITTIDAINDIADDAELCSSRTNIDSLDFETTAELNKARIIESENQQRQDQITRRENELQRRIEKRQKKIEESMRRAQELAREEEEMQELNKTEANLENSSSDDEEEDKEKHRSSLVDPYIALSPEEKARRKKVKDQFVKTCKDAARETADELQRQALEMQLENARAQRTNVTYQVQFNERQIERMMKVQEQAKLLLDKYHEDIQEMDKLVEDPRKKIMEQIKRNNAVLAEAKGELSAIQQEIQTIENQLEETTSSAKEAVSRTENA